MKKTKVKYREFLEEAEKKLGVRPSHIEVSNALGGSPNPNALGARLCKDSFLSVAEYNILYKEFLDTNEKQVKEIKAEGKMFEIPYWERAKEFECLLTKPTVTECFMDMQVIKNEWLCEPENLRIITMFGDEMDGVDFPIKNQDLLIIDISRTNTAESGVFVATSHGGTRIYVRRIIEKMSCEYSYVTTIDHPRLKDIITKKWTMQQWKEADIQIVGRVIKNMSLKI